jgi:hypothetical protein
LGLKNLDLANIVILGNHNPGIITQQWLKDNGLITEDPRQALNTLAVSFFESEHYSLIVEPVRLQLNAKEKDKGAVKAISNILLKYINVFPNLNYKAVGLNFIWTYEIVEGEKYIIKTSINKFTDLQDIFINYQLNLGSIIYAKKEPYLLKLIIDPLKENLFQHNFNYHFEITKANITKISDYLNMYAFLYDESQVIIENLTKGEKV